MNRRTFVTALAVAPFALQGGHAAASHDVVAASREYEVQGVTKITSSTFTFGRCRASRRHSS